MGKKRHIVIAKLFDSGGMNTHFSILIHYLNAEKVILILESEQQREFLKETGLTNFRSVHVIPNLHSYAHLEYRPTTNIKEALLIVRSLTLIFWLSMINGLACITISAAEPEKYLYLFWLPFLRVVYILHSEPIQLMSRFTRFTCNTCLGRKKYVVTVSNSMKRAICAVWHLAQGKNRFVAVVHNCLLKDSGLDTGQKERTQGRLQVTTMGHVDKRKNPATWLEVAKVIIYKYPGVEFVWLGNGALLEEYRALTAGMNHIIFTGKVKNVQSWLCETAVYYQPSLIEPHGIAVVEAMSAGLPCVVANTGGLPESVEEGVNGYVVEPTDLMAHVSAIESLLENALLRQVYGQNSRKRYKALFTYSRFIEKMDEVYN